MKTITSIGACLRGALLYAAVACLFFAPAARAGLTIDLHLYHQSYGYYCYPFLNTNATSPGFPVGDYLVTSPQYPTNGSTLKYHAGTNSFDFGIGGDYGGGAVYVDFDSFLRAMTNGLWSIYVTNGSTTQYQFTVSISGLSSEVFGPYAMVTYPLNHSLGIPADPVFTWSGPTNWPSGYVNFNDNFVDASGNEQYFYFATLPQDTVEFETGVLQPAGTNKVSVNYFGDATGLALVSAPTNSAGQPISGWVSTASLEADSDASQFVVVSNALNQFLVARYDFENTNNPGHDSSGNGNDFNCSSSSGPLTDLPSTNAAVHLYAREFYGETSLCLVPGDLSFANASNALSGSFTLTAWVNTTNSINQDFANAYFGAPIWFEYSSGVNQVIVSITGSKAAFTVGNPDGGSDTTLHSTVTVNDGVYHLIAATRDQDSGLMSLYVDGSLQATGISTNGPRPTAGWINLAGGYNNYTGLLDDVRIYSTNLAAADIAGLFANASTFAEVLGAPDLTFTSTGDSLWFVENTNTFNGAAAAAQSGSVTGNQSSTLSATVTGPGTLTFAWSSIANDPNGGFDYTFTIDGVYQNDIYGNTDWVLENDPQTGQPYAIPAGPHTLGWTVVANGDIDPTQAGFLDQVTYVATSGGNSNTAPIITLDPFNQTNYPGYQVALLAGATSNPAATWEWFEVGNASPIPGATNALYIPTNSGTAAVAGSYYAIASNLVGTATTATAVVNFVTAPLPPDWSIAYTTQLQNDNNVTTNYNIACLLDLTGTNVYTVGSFAGTNHFGSDALVNSSGAFGSSFLKQTIAGTAVWGRGLTNNGNGSSYAQCVVAAPGGGIYAAGVLTGTNWLGTNRLADVGGGSTYLVRLDADGNVLWIQNFVGTNGNFTEYHGLTSDPAGNVTLSALISGTTRIGSSNVTAIGQVGVLAQFDATGSLRWLQMPSSWPSYLVYSGGAIYGGMGGSATNYIGGITNVSDRNQALFSLNATNGNGNWIKGIAAAADQGNPFGFIDQSPLLAVSGTNLFVAGNAWGSNAVFGPYSVHFTSAKGNYLAAYDTNGNPQFATGFGSPYTWPWSMQADDSGNIYIGSDFDNYAIFGSDVLAAPFYETVQSLGSQAPGARIPGQTCVAKFDHHGNPLWARMAQSESGFVNSRDLFLSADGVWSCGFFNQQTDFGSIAINGQVTCVGSPLCTLQYHPSGYLAKIPNPSTHPAPLTLINPSRNGAALQFQFTSQSGFSHLVKYTTNVATPLSSWLTYTNLSGDGTLKTVIIPWSVFSPSKQGFVRIQTQ